MLRSHVAAAGHSARFGIRSGELDYRGGIVHVVAFAPSLKADMNDAGGVDTQGFPMTSATVESFPAQIVIPVVLAVYTQGGTDYDPERFIVARSSRGEEVGLLQWRWHWPDTPGSPVKFRVFAHLLTLRLPSPGVYTIGLYESRDDTETSHTFPMPVHKADPFRVRGSLPLT